MAGLLDSIKDNIKKTLGEAEQAKIARRKISESTVTPDLLSGPAKMVLGGLGAVPTAIGKTIEATPGAIQRGVGKILGAVPINPVNTNYGDNPSLELAGEGVRETGQGLRAAGRGVRSGIMSAMGLKEAPITAPSPTPLPVTSPLPATVKPFVTSATIPATGGLKKTKDQFMGDITATRVETPSAPKREIAGTITMGDKTIEIPKSGFIGTAPELGVVKPVRDYNAEIDNLVSQLMNDPNSRRTQAMSGGYIKTGGLKKSVLDTIAGLRGHQITAAAGLEGHKITAEVTKAGHETAAKERTAIERDRLAETTRYHDILKMNAKDKADQDKFLREEALNLRKIQGEEAAIKTFGQYVNNLGETSYHPAIAVFKMIDSGYDTNTLSPQYRSIADRLKIQLKEYAISARKANSKLTPAQIKEAFYEELRGIK